MAISVSFINLVGIMEWFRIENREKLNLEMYKGRRLEPLQNVYAHILAGLNLTLTMHIWLDLWKHGFSECLKVLC